jgi:hypothetical protein
MSDNKKQEKDFTKEVDALLPEAAATVKVFLVDLHFNNTNMPSYSTGW